MKSLEDLRKIRERVEREMELMAEGSQPQIIIGMGTCGIAAGARNILKTVLEEIARRDLKVDVTQTGCIGMCEQEPLLDVRLPGRPRVTYGKLKERDVRKVIIEHVVNGNVVEELAIARMED